MRTIGRTASRPFRALQVTALALLAMYQGPCALTSEEVRAIASNSFQGFVNGLVANVVKDLFNAAFGLN